MKKNLLLTACCLLFVAVAHAQPPPPPPPGPLSGTDVPFDNQSIVLLVAVSIFGVYKIYKKKSVNLSTKTNK